jgi:hypothetical protein
MESWRIIEMLKELDPSEKVLSIKVTDDNELTLVGEDGEEFLIVEF